MNVRRLFRPSKSSFSMRGLMIMTAIIYAVTIVHTYHARNRAIEELIEARFVVTLEPSRMKWLGRFAKDPFFAAAKSVSTPSQTGEPHPVSPQIAQLFGYFPELEELDLRRSLMTDEGLYHLRSLERLKTLCLVGCPEVNGSGFRHLVNLKSLQILYLSGSPCGDGSMASLGQLRNLRELYLNGCPVTSEGVKHLASLRTLEVLGLAGSKVDDSGLGHFVGFKRLRFINLMDTDIGDEGVTRLSEIPSLEEIMIGITHVTDKSLEQLKKLDKLVYLDVGFTKVTEQGVADMRAALPKLDLVSPYD